ncbi:MAG: hypothetical protein AAF557_03190 [Pseudomonadota bacterium]
MQDKNVDRRLDDVEIPLKNIEFTIQQYLLAHGSRLDTETRILLAGIRDCVGRVATSPGAHINAPSARIEVPELMAG